MLLLMNIYFSAFLLLYLPPAALSTAGLGDEFDDNERRLKEYLKSVDDLNGKMREHLQTIEKRAEFHRSCVP